jgi:hypothetical protein
MLEPELGRRKSWSDGLAHRLLINENSAQSTNRTRVAAVGEQRAANRTGAFVFRLHGPSQ